RLAQQFADEPIDLSVGPVFEAALLRISVREHVLILLLDHIVSDAASWGILSKEIWTSYSQAAHGQSSLLPNLSVQFPDYAVWQQRTHGAWLRKHEAYWRGHLSGAPRIRMPRDEGLPEAQQPAME